MSFQDVSRTSYWDGQIGSLGYILGTLEWGVHWDVLGANICRLGEFSSIPDTENTNEEEENSFVANSLLMLQQAQNNSISTKRTDSKSPDNKLDIELLIHLIRLFIAFGIHA